ncbi:MAG TPA: glycerol-3-phosphate 1-O-acyltransferase PlsY [Gemmataceae bacterium]|nr:glycerol-3-phosphate 1-O-acyltransferase PlsY [Gemmataceae bacterium]
MMLITASLVILAAYLVGSIPFGYLIARWRGVDIFLEGSGNIGATNVGRVLGRRFGILVFLLDFAKGAVPVGVARWITGAEGTAFPEDLVEVLAGLAAFLGHLFSIYLRFRGGKGVATAAGVVTVLVPVPTLGALLIWLSLLCATRYMSLASIIAAVGLCALRVGLTPEPFNPDHRILSLFCLVAAGLVVLRHRENVARLFHGTENRLRDARAMLLLSKTVHVLALGLWFGSTVFFSLVATPIIFSSFGSLGANAFQERPAWLPETLDKDKASQLAGLAVGPIFPWYFLLQGICGVLALAAAWSWPWSLPGQTVHKVRFLVLALALATVLIGWPLAQKVSGLRTARFAADPSVASSARAEFATWHRYSLLLNFVTMGLVAVAMALAARLPAEPSSQIEGQALPSAEEKKTPASPVSP